MIKKKKIGHSRVTIYFHLFEISLNSMILEYIFTKYISGEHFNSIFSIKMIINV